MSGGLEVTSLSDLVSDDAVVGEQLADDVDRGPAVVGFAAAMAVALGLCSGSDDSPAATCCCNPSSYAVAAGRS